MRFPDLNCWCEYPTALIHYSYDISDVAELILLNAELLTKHLQSILSETVCFAKSMLCKEYGITKTTHIIRSAWSSNHLKMATVLKHMTKSKTVQVKFGKLLTV